MGKARLELARPKPPHFECGASTNSAIRPQLYYYSRLREFRLEVDHFKLRLVVKHGHY